MRMIVISKTTDVKALSSRLLSAGATKESALQRLQQLNPHVDLKRLDAGTVLLVPDQLSDADSSSISGDAFASFQDQVRGAVDAAVAQVRNGYERRDADRADVSAVLKSAVIKRVLEADPDTKKQLEQAAQVFKQDQQQAKEAATQLQAFQKQVSDELAQLGKLVQ